MNRRLQFVLLVQTAVLSVERNLLSALARTKIVAEAMALPEESIPQDLLEGAWSFIQWKAMGYGEPAWMKEYRENIATKLYVEQCEGTRQWWLNAEQLLSTSHPKSWIAFVTGRKPVVEMTKRDATDFLEWAATVPGWSDDEPSARIHEEQPT